MNTKRASGVLLHITSLPGTYGVGSFNRSAYAFVDFLADAGQSIWQVLPLGPTSYGDSPYQSLSTFAGNPYLIGLEPLLEEGWLDKRDVQEAPPFIEGKTDYAALYKWKLPLLHKMAERQLSQAPAEFARWCDAQKWLEDYALFLVLKSQQQDLAWNQWPEPLRYRQSSALDQVRHRHATAIQREMLIQWLFFKQWQQLRSYAKSRNIEIFGDIPIFVAMDSSDSWANARLFQFNSQLQPLAVAGVPPDYFSPTGQLWGNPLYDWKAHKAEGYQWWIERVEAAFNMYDILRIDHFRGFAGYWRVPANAKTAETGKWVKGPGADLFKALQSALGERKIVAEDLGDITPDVVELRDKFDFPGMKILQFAYGSGPQNPFLPHNFESTRFVAYTGTHDNDTVRGWYESGVKSEQEYCRDYFGGWEEPVSTTLVRATLQSTAQWAIIPLQDLLDLGTEARMNYPGRSHDNWQWRLQPNQLEAKHRDQLKKWTQLYNR